MSAHWGSKLGFIMATAGSAIGLGNIWRFPYLVGKHGGGAFLLLYLACVVAMGYFILCAKLAFGRMAQTNIIDGFQATAKKSNTTISRIWPALGGWLTIGNIMLVAAVYVVVIGWTLSYVFQGISTVCGLSDQPIDEHLFKALTASFGYQFWCSFLCVAISGFVLIKGVKKGIEKISVYLMPILFCLLLFMVIWVMGLPDIGRGFSFFLKPNFAQMGFTEHGFEARTFFNLLLVAFGQSIYSLSLGLGTAFVYGSYLTKKTDIKKSARMVVVLDTLVAFLAGLIVIPAVFVFNMEPNQGPALSFISLPLIFSQMPGGAYVMLVFFVLLFLAALTSLISIFEVAINLLVSKWSLPRIRATGIVSGTALSLSALVLASMTEIIPIKVAGLNLFDRFDYVSSSYFMPLMLCVCCLFMGWKIFPKLMAELGQGSGHQSKVFKIYMKWILCLIAPIVIVIICLSGLV